MHTILGLSKTSTSIAWVLVDACDPTSEPLDQDAFDIIDSSAAAPAATARRVRDMAAASGWTVDAVHVTTSGNLSSLSEALRDLTFDEVVPVSPADATRLWALGGRQGSRRQNSAVCLLGHTSAALSVVDTCTGAMQSATTRVSGDSAALIGWLDTTLYGNGMRAELVYLIASRRTRDALAGPLAARLSVPAVTSRHAQVALARGAACVGAAAS
ncbi:hypothetical protein [Mycobacterium sp. 1274761.0]|uniref:hypothetical protein n=1 Tax=Mycobacterium sp. 1274761.0 TaxID=1834077 RepID=UPI0007FD2443|nr:hypothetical protein [Mycobacterium sp. 1274761.0]OBK78801.1 hypothetical protein A5651_02485 [Mycobacterium sp. 1274761.0]